MPLAVIGGMHLWKSGHLTYLSAYFPDGRGLGFYPSQLIEFFPFVAHAFGLDLAARALPVDLDARWKDIG
ncbi:MAG: hypothetical protein HC875_40185 [Anaerolineales bacterium]|nr:hypothetical protein [Anaerolineales bacterium]